MFPKTVSSLCLLLTIFIVGASSLSCNLCIGSLDSDCARNVSAAFVKQTCVDLGRHGAGLKSLNNLVDIGDEQELDIYCIALTMQDTVVTSSLAERACGYIYRGVDICSFVKNQSKDVLSCEACQEDYCN